jgi:hypothetical protein
MKKLYVIVIVFLFTACQQTESTPPPADLLPQAKFAQVHKEVRLLEGAYAARYTKVDTSAYTIESYYKKLFQDQGVTADQYKSSFSYYSKNPIIMMAIENELLTQLTAMQTEQDSINRLRNESVLDSLEAKKSQ